MSRSDLSQSRTAAVALFIADIAAFLESADITGLNW